MIGKPTWCAVLIVHVGGCDRLFQIDHVEPVRAPNDSYTASNDAPSLAKCTSPLVHDRFDDPCATWANTYVNDVSWDTGNGVLTITPYAGAPNAIGACTSRDDLPLGNGGVAVRVATIARGMATYTLLQLSSTTALVQVGATGDGKVRFQTGPGMDVGVAVDFSPLSVWWRIRPLPLGLVVGEYSADGVEWNVLGTTPAPGPASFKIEINAGAVSSNVSGFSAYDELMICP